MITSDGTTPALCAAAKTRQTCTLAEEASVADSMALDTAVDSGYETSSDITPPRSVAAATPQKHVRWAPTADVRVVYCGYASPCDDTNEDLWVNIEGDGERDEPRRKPAPTNVILLGDAPGNEPCRKPAPTNVILLGDGSVDEPRRKPSSTNVILLGDGSVDEPRRKPAPGNVILLGDGSVNEPQRNPTSTNVILLGDGSVDSEEAAIRQQLVGCLANKARRRPRGPDFGVMYGCGPCVHSSCPVTSAECSDNDSDHDDYDSDDDDDEPLRVVVACSMMESSVESIFTVT